MSVTETRNKALGSASRGRDPGLRGGEAGPEPARARGPGGRGQGGADRFRSQARAPGSHVLSKTNSKELEQPQTFK